MPVEVRRQWYGDILEARMRRAAGRSVIAIGENVAADTKRVTHVISGNLRRSVHTAPAGYLGADDLAHAVLEDIPGVNDVGLTLTPEGAVIEVGSWMPYACVEWVGRGHPGVTQGLEANRGARPTLIIKKAFAEEGLS
jgi:hypothetical protein